MWFHNVGLRELGTSGEKIPLLSTANTWSAHQTFNGGITGALTGNADTATKLKTARTINGVGFDGSTDITLTPENLGLTDIVSQAGNAVQRSGDKMTGELKIGTVNALRIFDEAFGLIFRRSEDFLHFIPTAEGQGENGNIGPLRPFAINLRTGAISASHGARIDGGLAISTDNALGGNSITLGDNDTGFRQNGDGILDVYANGAHVFRFINGNNESVRSLVVHGNCHATGALVAGNGSAQVAPDGNVYGTLWGGWLNEWLNNNVVKDIRLGSVESVAAWNGPGYYDSWGYVLTGAINGNNDAYIDTLTRRPLQKFIGGQWYAVGSI